MDMVNCIQLCTRAAGALFLHDDKCERAEYTFLPAVVRGGISHSLSRRLSSAVRPRLFGKPAVSDVEWGRYGGKRSKVTTDVS